MKIWLLLIVIYVAPYSAVDWDGPWQFGMSRAMDKTTFKSEAECRNTAIRMIAEMHQGMLAPMRFECVPFDASLPKGAPR